MKTAMQELIKWIDNDFRKQSTIPTIQQLKNKAEYLLEKEKEQIMNAYWEGGQDVPTHNSTVEEYYNQTYNQKNNL
jgi:hypothetical protein